MAKHFTKSDIEKAILKSGGIMTTVAKRLKCDWATARKYVNEFDCAEALQNEKEGLLDLAEGMLMQNIKNGDTPSIFYYLNNQGRSRGYNLKEDIKKQDDININIEFTDSPKLDNIEGFADVDTDTE